MYKESIKWMFYHWLRVKRFKPKTKRSIEKIADRLSTAHFILTNTKIDDPVMQQRLIENYRGYVLALYQADIITPEVYEELNDLIEEDEEMGTR
jgi:hypothetical protein